LGAGGRVNVSTGNIKCKGMRQSMKYDKPKHLWLSWVFVMFAGVIFCADQRVSAEEIASPGGDSLFENQIRSMTAEKPELKPSGDPRFKNNRDNTVTDLEQGLMWKQQDSYQERKEWINWESAQLYIQEINENKFSGYSDWRLPTREELLTLYEEDKSIPWFYYWTTNEVHLDPVFGYTSCCFWTSELHKDKYAWHVNFIRGKAYPSIKGGTSLSLSAIRLVRNAGSSTEARANK